MYLQAHQASVYQHALALFASKGEGSMAVRLRFGRGTTLLKGGISGTSNNGGSAHFCSSVIERDPENIQNRTGCVYVSSCVSSNRCTAQASDDLHECRGYCLVLTALLASHRHSLLQPFFSFFGLSFLIVLSILASRMSVI